MKLWKQLVTELASDGDDAAVVANRALEAIERGEDLPSVEILGLAWMMKTKGEGTLW